MVAVKDVKTAYKVTFDSPESHWFGVEATFSDLPENDHLEIFMAAWCPGSYLIRDYARHVSDVTANGSDGEERRIVKNSKHSWKIERKDDKRVTVRYKVYGHDLSVRTNHVTSSHAFIHSPAAFMYASALADKPHSVRLQERAGWTQHASLHRIADEWIADDLDQLMDTPFHSGQVKVHDVKTDDLECKLAIWGKILPGKFTEEDLVSDLANVLSSHKKRFSGYPFSDYLFLLMIAPNAYGGLEHKTSSANLNNPYAFADEKSYGDLLELLSHEFFHSWNGKRIFPKPFEVFDYQTENYTSCLWVVEGITSYLDRYTMRQAGVMSTARYFEKLATEWERLQAVFGRSRQSLAESSFDAWIKLYKPHESNVNTSVSYYLKGGMVCLCLDLLIRRESGGKRNLDEVLVHLWKRYGEKGLGYPEDLRPDFELATDLSLEAFFAAYIEGKEDPPLADLLGNMGLELAPTWSRSEKEEAPGFLGASFADGSTTISTVVEGSPGFLAGLSPGDKLLAINGMEILNAKSIASHLTSESIGKDLQITLFRGGHLETATVIPAESPADVYEIRVKETATLGERQAYANWMGEDLPENGVLGKSIAGSWV